MSDIIKYETDHGDVKLSAAIIRRYLVSGTGKVTDQEIMMFLSLCKYQRLNPFLREAYLIKYSDMEPASIVVGKDVQVKRACKNQQFDGIRSGVIIFKDDKIIERDGTFTLPTEKIVGAWAEGKRKDWTIPRKVTVSFEEFVGKKKDGSANRQWSRMPGVMIVKVAESHCLRAMFPEDLQGLYGAEEMQIEPETLPMVEIKEPETKEPDNDSKNESPQAELTKEYVQEKPLNELNPITNRQTIINQIGAIMKDLLFTEDERDKVRNDIKKTTNNKSLETIRDQRKADYNKRYKIHLTNNLLQLIESPLIKEDVRERLKREIDNPEIKVEQIEELKDYWTAYINEQIPFADKKEDKPEEKQPPEKKEMTGKLAKLMETEAPLRIKEEKEIF